MNWPPCEMPVSQAVAAPATPQRWLGQLPFRNRAALQEAPQQAGHRNSRFPRKWPVGSPLWAERSRDRGAWQLCRCFESRSSPSTFPRSKLGGYQVKTQTPTLLCVVQAQPQDSYSLCQAPSTHNLHSSFPLRVLVHQVLWCTRRRASPEPLAVWWEHLAPRALLSSEDSGVRLQQVQLPTARRPRREPVQGTAGVGGLAPAPGPGRTPDSTALTAELISDLAVYCLTAPQLSAYSDNFRGKISWKTHMTAKRSTRGSAQVRN